MTLQWPQHMDWRHWADRFDRMQERYLVSRAERFDVIVRTIRAIQPVPQRVLDLGCGTGSLGLAILNAFPQCELVGVDVDESMLALATARLAEFGPRASVLRADLRAEDWHAKVGNGFDAAVSATALHWLSADHLSALYGRVADLLLPGGILLNADHVGSERPAIQQAWQTHREAMRQVERTGQASESWDEFWQAYAAALGVDIAAIGAKSVGPWEGVEDGLPLAWHFDRLREAGFAPVDCFWRSDCDAIYGGVVGKEQGS